MNIIITENMVGFLDRKKGCIMAFLTALSFEFMLQGNKMVGYCEAYIYFQVAEKWPKKMG